MAVGRLSREVVWLTVLNLVVRNASSYVPTTAGRFGGARSRPRTTILRSGSDETTTAATTASTTTTSVSFIDTELRGAAMRLHTRKQAPKEGRAPEQRKKEAPYATTHADYLAFLVDSRHVYVAFEEAVRSNPALARFRDTGMERTEALDRDVRFIVDEYDVPEPPVGSFGKDYADLVRTLANEDKIPEFLCHFYNHYFAHTAGGMMIGKRMSALLLDKRTLEFYKWEGNINEIKTRVKANIEDFVLTWNADEKQRCVDQTAAAFKGGGSINSYLRGGRPAH